MTQRERCEAWVRRDYADRLGKVIRVRYLHGYKHADSVDLYFDPPIAVRVLATPESDLIRYSDPRWLDPNWEVVPVEVRPELEGVRSCWADGITYDVTTGIPESQYHVLSDSEMARIYGWGSAA